MTPHSAAMVCGKTVATGSNFIDNNSFVKTPSRPFAQIAAWSLTAKQLYPVFPFLYEKAPLFFQSKIDIRDSCVSGLQRWAVRLERCETKNPPRPKRSRGI
jgi:hypothetical protein